MENGLFCEEDVFVFDDMFILKFSCDWDIGIEIKSK